MPELALEPGRLRKVDAGLVTAAAAWGGAVWFGWTGAVLMTIVAARLWPSRRVRITWGEPVAALRLDQRCVSFRCGLRVQCVYRDELPAEDYARLRRELTRLVGRGAESPG
jgi:hypothetical protein